MKYFKYDNLEIPLTCIQGFSYTKAANLIPTGKLNFRSNGFNSISIAVQITLTLANCMNDAALFESLKQKLLSKTVNKESKPSQIQVGDDIILPQLYFMLSNVNINAQSDRNDNLQSIAFAWTLISSKVSKVAFNRSNISNSTETQLPKVVFHCKGKSLECKDKVQICDLYLNKLGGNLTIVVGDTYSDVEGKGFHEILNTNEAYITVDGEKYYIVECSAPYDLVFQYELRRLDKRWYSKTTKTFFENTSLSEIFKGLNVVDKTRIKVDYYKMDCTPFEALTELYSTLGFLYTIKDNEVILYNIPSTIKQGSVTYEYFLEQDNLSLPINEVILRDGLNEYTASSDDFGTTTYKDACCTVSQKDADRLLKFYQFDEHMYILTLPIDKKVFVGCLVTINNGNELVNCIVTAYDIDYMSNKMTLEVHYV